MFADLKEKVAKYVCLNGENSSYKQVHPSELQNDFRKVLAAFLALS